MLVLVCVRLHLFMADTTNQAISDLSLTFSSFISNSEYIPHTQQVHAKC